MSETATTPATEQPTPAATPAQVPPAKSDDLPEWARQQISKANGEAAQYRVQLREAETARASLEEQLATLTTEKTQAVDSHTTVQTDFDKLVTAIQAEVPIEHVFSFAKTLQGSTAEELTAHAVELKNMFGNPGGTSPAVDRSQGLGGDKVNTDPASVLGSLIASQLTR